jgi:hypothetical protein
MGCMGDRRMSCKRLRCFPRADALGHSGPLDAGGSGGGDGYSQEGMADLTLRLLQSMIKVRV